MQSTGFFGTDVILNVLRKSMQLIGLCNQVEMKHFKHNGFDESVCSQVFNIVLYMYFILSLLYWD